VFRSCVESTLMMSVAGRGADNLAGYWKMVNTAQRYLKILREQPNMPKFLVSRVLWRTGLCSLFQIQKEGYRLKFHPTALSAILWIDPQDRGNDEAFLKRYLKEGDTVVDVGANIGDLTLTAALAIGPKGKVYSLEAHPRTYGFLRKNIALNNCSNIILFNLALGDKESEIFFSDLKWDDQNHVSGSSRGISVKMARLDHLALLESHIQLLKIDVEGYEKFVLDGASTTLGKVSCIYFESWERHFSKYGYACRDVINLLTGKGFTVLKFVDNESVVPVKVDHSSTVCENLVAVRTLEDFLERTQFRLTA
jgi:FkbM family methyltransferase